MTPDPPLFTELSARRLGPVRRLFVRRPVISDVLVVLSFGLWSILLTGGARSMFPLDAVLGPQTAAAAQYTGVALTALGMLTLVWRRRFPVVVAAVMGALGATALLTTGLSAGFELGLPLALYAVAASRAAHVTWLTVAGTLTAILVAGGSDMAITVGAAAAELGDAASIEAYAREHRPEIWWAMAASLVIPTLFCLAVGTSVRNRRLHVADLVDRANALARDRDQEARLARAAERARIAREMHDVVAHSLTQMIALGDGAASAVRRSPEQSRAALEELSTTGRAALADMRRLLGVLHGDAEQPAAAVPFEPQPTAPDLAVIVDRYRAAGLPVRASGLGEELPPDPGLQLAVVRIVEQALQNAREHAHGTLGVEVSVRRVPGGLEVDVVDRGSAAAAAAPDGATRGLIGMKERAAAYGGTVEAGPHGNGWRVHAWLPWDEGTR